MITYPNKVRNANGELSAPAASVALAAAIERLRRLVMLPSLYLFLAVATVMRAEIPPVIFLALVLGAIAALWRVPTSDYRLGLLYVLGFSVFGALRVFADETGRAVSYDYPVTFDTALFGTLPTTWLQDRFYVPGQIGVLDSATMLVYASYFKGHYVGALLIWIFKRELLKTYIVGILATLYLGLICYYVLPTSPPWLASETGRIPEVFRIFHLATNEVWSGAMENGTHIAGTNDVGAMPSLHTGLTAAMAAFFWRINRPFGGICSLYVALMGFSLIYLGEHYLVDVLAGLVVGIAAVHLSFHFLGETSEIRSQTSQNSQQRPTLEGI